MIQKELGTYYLLTHALEDKLQSIFYIFQNCTKGTTYLLDVRWGQPIKLIQVVSTSEFHEY